MKIFIPFKIKDIGGTSTFANIFSENLRKNDFNVTSEFEPDYDALFIIADCPLRYVLHAKIHGRKIIQRLDGIYHPATPFGKWYWMYNLKMKIIHNYFANFVIYQSNFSKLSCEKFLGKRNGIFEIIHNGVNLPSTKIKPASENIIKLITFSQFRRKDQIVPMIEIMKNMPKNYTLDIYGSFEGEVSDLQTKIEKMENIKYKGKLQHSKLLSELSRYDIFLFSDQSACPNSVLEAMASGLAIVAFNRGSIGELVKTGYNGEVIDLITNDAFSEPFPFSQQDYDAFRGSILRTVSNINNYKEASKKEASDSFSLTKMMQKYYEVLRYRK